MSDFRGERRVDRRENFVVVGLMIYVVLDDLDWLMMVQQLHTRRESLGQCLNRQKGDDMTEVHRIILDCENRWVDWVNNHRVVG
jgi:hypothetical protein